MITRKAGPALAAVVTHCQIKPSDETPLVRASAAELAQSSRVFRRCVKRRGWTRTQKAIGGY